MANKTMKHLGPLCLKGNYICRDCNRTFSKGRQYQRHIKACTNVPISASHIDTDFLLMSKYVNLDDDVNYKPGRQGTKAKLEISREEIAREIQLEADNVVETREMCESIVSTNKGVAVEMAVITDIGNNEYLCHKEHRFLTIAEENTISKIPLQCEEAENYNSKESWKCGLCWETYKEREKLEAHTFSCHIKDIRNINEILRGNTCFDTKVCPICGLHYLSTSFVLTHLVTVHTKQLQSVFEETAKTNKHIPCSWCNHESVSHELHIEHLAIEHQTLLTTKQTISYELPVVDTSKILSEVETSCTASDSIQRPQKEVICTDCGTQFKSRTYLNNHKYTGACDRQPIKNFPCPKPDCGGLAFYKLKHLFTHLLQVHKISIKSHQLAFDRFKEFHMWRHKEELAHRVRFVNTFRRIVRNCANTTWVCHRFHCAQQDRRQEQRRELPSRQWCTKIQRSAQCYARLHVQTYKNTLTGQYDGKTEVNYYPDHNHPEGDPPPQVYSRVMDRRARRKKNFLLKEVQQPSECQTVKCLPHTLGKPGEGTAEHGKYLKVFKESNLSQSVGEGIELVENATLDGSSFEVTEILTTSGDESFQNNRVPGLQHVVSSQAAENVRTEQHELNYTVGHCSTAGSVCEISLVAPTDTLSVEQSVTSSQTGIFVLPLDSSEWDK